MGRILLINPAVTYLTKSLRTTEAGTFGLPLGLLYIAAAFEENGMKVRVLDTLLDDETVLRKQKGELFRGILETRLEQILDEFDPDIVGVSSHFSTQENNVINTARACKKKKPGITVIAGGANASIRGKELVSSGYIDIAVRGEGEEVFPEIFDHILQHKELSDINGIVYRSGEKINETAGFSYVDVLDKLPFPAYHLVDMERYLELYKKGVFSRDRDVRRNISMITSRGCPYNCVFCSIHLITGRKWRAHTPEYVSRHLRFLAERHDVRHIHFEDDNLLLDKGRFEGVMETLKEEGFTWDTPNGVRVDPSIDGALIRKIKMAGCKSLTIGVESGDQSVLDNVIEKDIKLEDVEEMASLCKKHGLPLRMFFILGLPGETLGTMRRTMDFGLYLLGEYDVEIMNFIATPIYGTRLYRICDENGYFTEKITPEALSESTVPEGRALIETDEFRHEQVEELSKQFSMRIYRIMVRKYIWHPIKALKRIGNIRMLKHLVLRLAGRG